MLVLVPVPLVVAPPGLLVRVHVPVDGRPLKATLPVPKLQVVWVIVPIVGAAGVTGWLLITTGAEAADKQPTSLVTV